MVTCCLVCLSCLFAVYPSFDLLPASAGLQNNSECRRPWWTQDGSFANIENADDEYLAQFGHLTTVLGIHSPQK